MKKYILLALLLAIPSLAQAGMMEDVKWAAFGGANYTTFSTNVSGTSASSDLGFMLGGAGMLPLDRQQGIVVGLSWAMKNGKWTASGTEKKLQTNYIEVPVLYHYMINESWGVHGGVYGSYLLSSTLAGVNNKSSMSSIDYGITAGVGYMYQNWLFGAGYSLGLKDVDGSSNESKVSGFTAKVGYLFM